MTRFLRDRAFDFVAQELIVLRNGSGPGSTFSLPSQTNAILVSSSQFRPEDASVASVGKLRANETKPEGNNEKLLL